MILKEALEIVLELASQSVLTDEDVAGSDVLQDEQARQNKAVETVYSLATKDILCAANDSNANKQKQHNPKLAEFQEIQCIAFENPSDARVIKWIERNTILLDIMLNIEGMKSHKTTGASK